MATSESDKTWRHFLQSKCEHWWGRVGIHDDRQPQVIAFCKSGDAFWSLLPLVVGVLLMAENFRDCQRKCLQCHSANRTQILLPLVAFGSSIYPIFFNHWVVFMYVNDHWYTLFPVQLLFTITDDVALLLRFCDAFPEARAAIHSCHLLFLFILESRPWKLAWIFTKHFWAFCFKPFNHFFYLFWFDFLKFLSLFLPISFGEDFCIWASEFPLQTTHQLPVAIVDGLDEIFCKMKHENHQHQRVSVGFYRTGL